MTYVFTPPAIPSVEVSGTLERFPVHRIYCVGRNYAAHAREMGKDPERDPPFFFSKPNDTIVPNGASVAYPPETSNLHHEIELVVAIGKGGQNIPREKAHEHIFGYAVGNDLTRRDLQLEARDKGRPWDTGKGFDQSAPITAIRRASDIGHPEKGRIWISVNDQIKQDGDLSELIWSVTEIVSILSGLFKLQPGDLIFTGTPAGVGPVERGDVMTGGVEGVGELSTRIL
ncbi:MULTISPECIES: fumarylacetoacetate hydrolase family protein [unclassified Iodidimonas]|jgi:fumarylpyruvate hydrolase|uniref:fumarylacetoacetate hydrolase family protein n=1 Tax=unclassified Iodidimonas TaxID=2626145 RepID=UPI002482DC8F|nr:MULTISPECIES: fumarylacetoacetate hydrolase family protein [unclassified Iodidimonas]